MVMMNETIEHPMREDVPGFSSMRNGRRSGPGGRCSGAMLCSGRVEPEDRFFFFLGISVRRRSWNIMVPVRYRAMKQMQTHMNSCILHRIQA